MNNWKANKLNDDHLALNRIRSSLGSSTWATFDVFSSYYAHKSLKSALSNTVSLPLACTVKQSPINTSIISKPLHQKYAIAPLTIPSQFGSTLQVEVSKTVMYPFREQFLHLIEKLATPCCLSISSSYNLDTPTTFGNVSLQEEHLILTCHLQSQGITMDSTFSVLAITFKQKIGISPRYPNYLQSNTIIKAQLAISYITSQLQSYLRINFDIDHGCWRRHLSSIEIWRYSW